MYTAHSHLVKLLFSQIKEFLKSHLVFLNKRNLIQTGLSAY